MDVRWITVFIDRGSDGFEETVEFWSATTGSSLSTWRGDANEFATLLPLDGTDAHLRVQRTGTGSSRSHIDLHVVDVASATEECVGFGATVGYDHGGHVVLATPGGMEFCLVAHHSEHERQHPVPSVGGGTSTLVDQVSIDCDPDLFDDEVRYWSSVTGWVPLAARAREFVPLDRPVVMPLRIMLQRRSQSVGLTSCHLDVACDDVASAADEHSERGAAIIERHQYWTVMADPSGTAYCLTAREPNTGHLPTR